ncbi:MAG: Hsp20/alpha crystallin family protein [bacterium]
MRMWDPFREIQDLQRSLNRLLDESLMARRGVREFPLVNIDESAEDFVLETEIPGVEMENIKVTATGNYLTIEGERKPDEIKGARLYVNERGCGQFKRTIKMPVPIESGQVRATYKDGVLRIVLPKAEEVKPRTIKIGVS